MILYFTGTGNSRYVAEAIARLTGDCAVSINDQMKQGRKGDFISERPYVFVCPTYAWRLPRVVEAFIRSGDFLGSKDAYFVLTCGTDTQNAAGHAERLCREKGLNFRGLAPVIMPENYIAMFPTPDRETAKHIIREADPVIRQIAERIGRGDPLPPEAARFGKPDAIEGFRKESLPRRRRGFEESGAIRGFRQESLPTPPKCGPIGRLQSGVINRLFYALFVRVKGFRATENCVGCGRCAELCPLNNLTMADGKPVWGGRCTHCMACICGCPKEAVEYGNKSQGKPRYYLPAGGE